MLPSAITTLLAATSVMALPQQPKFDRFFVIVMENTDVTTAMKDNYLGNVLANKGRLLTNMRGVSHPSQGNYIAMTTGRTLKNNFDNDVDVETTSVVDSFEEAGISWGTYQEDYPIKSGCFTKDNGLYRRKHNPFISINNIRNSPARCAKIKSADQLDVDIRAGTVPQYVYYTPNMNNDAHDTDIAYGSRWMQSFLDPLLENPYFKNTLFVVTFDENDAFAGVIDFKKNRIYTALIGAGVTAGSKDDSYYNHYSQIATLTKYWGIKPLGRGDVDEQPFNLA